MKSKAIDAGASVSEARNVIRRQYCGDAPNRGDVEILWRAALTLVEYAREVENVVAKVEGQNGL